MGAPFHRLDPVTSKPVATPTRIEVILTNIDRARAAYARHCKHWPVYEDGTPRPAFDAMPDPMRNAWIRSPYPVAGRPQNPERIK